MPCGDGPPKDQHSAPAAPGRRPMGKARRRPAAGMPPATRPRAAARAPASVRTMRPTTCAGPMVEAARMARPSGNAHRGHERQQGVSSSTAPPARSARSRRQSGQKPGRCMTRTAGITVPGAALAGCPGLRGAVRAPSVSSRAAGQPVQRQQRAAATRRGQCPDGLRQPSAAVDRGGQRIGQRRGKPPPRA